MSPQDRRSRFHRPAAKPAFFSKLGALPCVRGLLHEAGESERRARAAGRGRRHCGLQERRSGAAAARRRRRGAGGDERARGALRQLDHLSGAVRQSGAQLPLGCSRRSGDGPHRARPLGRRGADRAGHCRSDRAARTRARRRAAEHPLPRHCGTGLGRTRDEPPDVGASGDPGQRRLPARTWRARVRTRGWRSGLRRVRRWPSARAAAAGGRAGGGAGAAGLAWTSRAGECRADIRGHRSRALRRKSKLRPHGLRDRRRRRRARRAGGIGGRPGRADDAARRGPNRRAQRA